MLGRFLERNRPGRVNQVPEARCIEIENGPGKVDGHVVVEQAACGELKDSLCDGELPGGWRPWMYSSFTRQSPTRACLT